MVVEKNLIIEWNEKDREGNKPKLKIVATKKQSESKI